ncbi:MAG: SGNH/GDSL hydrolase family protein [Cyanobacteria bacterium J06639_18]
MKDFYLLTASLLTGLLIPTSTLPEISALQADNHQIPGKNKKRLESTARAETIPNTLFSSERIHSQKNYTPEKIYTPPKSFVPATITPTHRRPASGIQLYYQRFAALKAGHIYTRVADDNWQQLKYSSRKRKLTYQDWKKLLAMEARAMTRGQGTNSLSVLVGDSLSLWFPNERLPTGKLWLNQGISGDTSTGILKRLSAFSKTKPDVIYVMAGINDLRKGVKGEVIVRNHRKMIRNLRQNHPNSLIVVQSILPTRRPELSNPRIQRINQQLARIAKQEGVSYLNLHIWFTDSEGKLRKDLTTDGLHLSENGYAVWQSVLQQIESKLTAVRAVKLARS